MPLVRRVASVALDLTNVIIEYLLTDLGQSNHPQQFATVGEASPIVPSEGLTFVAWIRWIYARGGGESAGFTGFTSAQVWQFGKPTAPVPAWEPHGWQLFCDRLGSALYYGDKAAEPWTGAYVITAWDFPHVERMYGLSGGEPALLRTGAYGPLPGFTTIPFVYRSGRARSQRNYDYMPPPRPSVVRGDGALLPVGVAELGKVASKLLTINVPDQDENHVWPVYRMVAIKPKVKGATYAVERAQTVTVRAHLGTRPVKYPNANSAPPGPYIA